MKQKRKEEIINWCKDYKTSKIYVGNVIGGSKGVSCKCTKLNNEIKITKEKIDVNGQQYEYNDFHINGDNLVLNLTQNRKTIINSEDFFHTK